MLKNLNIITVLVVLAFASWPLQGQDVEFTASGKGNVQVGEQFRVVFSLNRQPSDFQGPDFEGLKVLSGPNASTSQSYQFINGKVSQSVQVTYTYYLQAAREGTYTIKPAKAVANGKTYHSNPLDISVTQASDPASARQGRTQAQQQGQTGQSTPSKDDIFIRASVDRSKAYQGEQVIITYKIYTTMPVSQINISKMSSFPGFWYKSLLNDNEPLKQYNEVINGREYVVADLRKIALYPQRSGEIRIEPIELECVAQMKVERTRTRDPFFDSFFNDPFFGRNYQNVRLVLESNPLTLNIAPLPASGRPAVFGGAVGSYTLSSRIDRNELKTNEPLTLTITIAGKGNIELIDALPVVFPPDFETYDPKITNNISRSAAGMSGTRTFEYLIIPRNAGDFTIRPVEFSFFDPSKQSYVSLLTQSFSIQVMKGDDEPSGITYSGVSQKNIRLIGSDIRHIKTGQIRLQPINTFFVASTAFLLWIIIPFVLFLAVVFLWKSYQKQKGDVALVRKRKANRVARKNLKQAGEYLRKELHTAFFEEISRALWGYISNKFNIPPADLSIESVNQHLSGKGVGEEMIEDFSKVLENCEYARFAPGEKSEKMQEIYQNALAVISKMEQELK